MIRSDTPSPRGKLSIVCAAWRPWHKNTLQGFASVEIVGVHESHGKFWAALPARPWVNGLEVLTDDAGKIRYSTILEFSRREVRDAFSRAVVRAVCERFPDALALEEAAT